MSILRFSVYIFSVSLLLLVTSCSTSVRTKVNTFRLDGATLGSGSIKVISPPDVSDSTLEYAYYSSYLQESLKRVGYTVVAANEDSDYVAFLNYSIRETEGDTTSRFSSSIFAGSRSGYLRRGSASGVGLVVVEDGYRRLLYQRTFQLVIAHANEKHKRVYEVTGVSRGQCDTLSAVFEEMLEAMLSNFPAGNGSIKNYSVRGDASC